MGRVFQHIEIDGRKYWTLFDTGARNSYVIPEVARLLVTSKLDRPFRSALGGGVKETDQTALLEGKVQGHRISSHAMVIDNIGKDENDNPIEVLFGALAMQQWGIRPVPDQETLDMSHYPTEFVEY
ncbi:MAG: aspartyl protease family protein [Pirellulales bacterium]